MRADELLTSHLPLIERAIAFACGRYGFSPDDLADFSSVVMLRLIDNDYAVVRAYEGRSSFTTFIGIVVQRMLLDYRIHQWGKWHASAEAKRIGALAVELEQLLHRDGRTLDDALQVLAPKHAGVTRQSLQSIADRLPERAPKKRLVSLENALPVAATKVEDDSFPADRKRTAERVSMLMNQAIDKLPADDRLILQMRFQEGMTVAQIARALRQDQKLLYRRVERCMRDIRKKLESTGIAASDVLDLLGRDDTVLQFDLRNLAARPSIATDETAASHPEGLS